MRTGVTFGLLVVFCAGVGLGQKLAPSLEIQTESQICNVTANDPDGDCIIGEAGIDYPTLEVAPRTSFACDDYEFAGVYADVEADCQVFHVCPPPGLVRSKERLPVTFMCPRGAMFNQEYRVCDWWFNVRCEKSADYFRDNEFFYINRGQTNDLLQAVNL